MPATLVRSKKNQTSDFSLRKHQTIGAAVATLAATEGNTCRSVISELSSRVPSFPRPQPFLSPARQRRFHTGACPKSSQFALSRTLHRAASVAE